jgi:hypothetical protein
MRMLSRRRSLVGVIVEPRAHADGAVRLGECSAVIVPYRRSYRDGQLQKSRQSDSLAPKPAANQPRFAENIAMGVTVKLRK